MSELIGQILAQRYRVDSFLGRGGMAEVYKVWDQQRATYLAMKLLRADLAEDQIFLRRFKREAQTLSQLQHPNIVRFYGLEQDDLLAFMLMDFVEGYALRTEIFRLQGTPMDTVRVRHILRPVCSALHYAHSNSMVHCDIKPANILINQHDQVMLTDFGIARMSDAATATMVGMGTPAYMAPEQARGLDPVPQTDIYALGIVLFEMLTGGERPFTGEQSRTTGSTSEKVRWEQINLPPPPPKRWNPDISDELEAVVLKCLAKDPAERFASPLELLNALELALPAGTADADEESLDDAETLVAVPSPIGETPEAAEESKDVSALPAEEKSRRRGLVPMLIGFAAIAIVAGAGLFVLGRGGIGPLAPPTDTPTVTATASPLPTETPEDTATPTPTQAASLTPSLTWTPTPTETATLEPSQTPMDTATSPPTDTATLEITLTPSPLPEGYAIVPDVTGLDFYTAGLRIQEAGFEIGKEVEYNPTISKNQVFQQEPQAGSIFKKLDEVRIIIASDAKVMLHGDKRGEFFVSIPENTRCEMLLGTISRTQTDVFSHYEVVITNPDGEQIVVLANSYARSDPIRDESQQFSTSIGGDFHVTVKIYNLLIDYQLLCKPPYNPTPLTPNSIQDQTGSTPTPLPEGYAIVPDVTGLDFYTAGLKLQETGFEVEKESEYNPTIPKNEVFVQEPTAGSGLQVGETVTITSAVETQEMLFGQTDAGLYQEFYVDIPADTECQFNLNKLAKIEPRTSTAIATIHNSQGDQIIHIRKVHFHPQGENVSRTFTTSFSDSTAKRVLDPPQNSKSLI